MAAKKDFKLNPPQKKTELTLERMLDYVESYYPDRLVELAELISKYSYQRKNTLKNIDRETVTAYDMKPIRAAFLEWFGDNEEFSALKKEKKESKKPETTEERLKRILGSK